MRRPVVNFDEAVSEFKRSYLMDLMENYAGNVSMAARAAGLNRTHLHHLLKRHGVPVCVPRRATSPAAISFEPRAFYQFLGLAAPRACDGDRAH